MENISLNFKKLCQDDYSPEQLFKPSTYDWPGDWEGRALLAFMCHYEINGSEVPRLHTFFSMIPERVNQYGYFGVPFDGETVDKLGRRFIDDKLIVSIRDKQMPIFSLNTVSMEEALALEVKIF